MVLLLTSTTRIRQPILLLMVSVMLYATTLKDQNISVEF